MPCRRRRHNKRVEIEWSDDRDEHGKQTAGLAVAWHVMQSRSFFLASSCSLVLGQMCLVMSIAYLRI
jgi:hypothetical protein